MSSLENSLAALDITDASATPAAPPDLKSVMLLGANGETTALSAVVTRWAVENKNVASAAFGAVAILGHRVGKNGLDQLVTASGEFLPSLTKALTTHSDSGMLTLGGLAALGTLSTGGGDSAWKESNAGCMRNHALVQAGALVASVRAMAEVGFPVDSLGMTSDERAWQIQRAGMHVLASCCFGHDGKHGFGKPKEAAWRRGEAAKSGAIEKIVDVMKAAVRRDPPKPAETREILDLAHRALQRVCMGHDKHGQARRDRAIAADCIPAYVEALDAFWSSDHLQMVLQTNMLLMNQSQQSRADPFLDALWQNEVAKYPHLSNRLREHMIEAARKDPNAVSRIRQANLQNVDLQNTATNIERAARKQPEPKPGYCQYADDDERQFFAAKAKELRETGTPAPGEPKTWDELMNDRSFQRETDEIHDLDDAEAYIGFLQKKNPRRLGLIMDPNVMPKYNDYVNRKIALRRSHGLIG